MIAAIYSRKSLFTGKGESIENQIELAKEYGNKLGVTDYLIYEDEGFSGSNLNRPKFQQLLKDAKSKKFDVLICYRLDRISRNVADFSTTLVMLQSNKIDFVSIKEQFDTSTPMGRAMVYISSVFAQLERETIAERVRDNMLLLAKTGRWLGGQEPYGYSAERVIYLDEELKERSLMKLIPIEEELKFIELIFSKYLKLRSITQVVKYINLTGIKGKNGGAWTTIQVKRVLSNPLYVKSSHEIEKYLKKLGINVFGEPNGNGYLTYNKTKNIVHSRDITEWIAAVGKHPGVIESTNWLEAQAIQKNNKNKKMPRLGTGDTTSLLSGVLKCEKCGSNMKIKQGHKSKKNEEVTYNYYVCANKYSSNGDNCNNSNIRVDELDALVLQRINAYSKELLIDELSAAINNEINNNPYLDKIESLKKSVSEKETAINNLVKQLALNSNDQVAKHIFVEIENLNNDIENLKDQLLKLQHSNLNFNSQTDNTEIALEALNKIDMEYKALNNIHLKRTLIQTIIEKITWDGDSGVFKIHLFNLNK